LDGAGTPMADTATVIDLAGNPSAATVTFNLYSSSTVQNSSTLLFTDTETVAVSGGTATATSANYTPTQMDAGTDYWVATFNGDANNPAVSSGAAAQPVNVDAISIGTPPFDLLGTPVSAFAGAFSLVSPSPADTITFTLYNSRFIPVFTDTETVSII